MDEFPIGNPELAVVIGQRLRDVRRARGWSQQALAQGLFSKGYVSSIEHGKIFPSVRALQALAGRLGVDMSEFFDPALVGGIEMPAVEEGLADARRNSLLLLELRALAAEGPHGILPRLRQVVPEALSPAERLELHYAVAQAHLAAGAPDAALATLEQALEELDAVGGSAAPQRALPIQVLIGEVLLARGQAHLAVEQFARLRLVAQEGYTPDPGLRLAILLGLARGYSALGEGARARAAYAEAATLAQENGSLDRLAQHWMALARQAAAAERWDEAAASGRNALLLRQTARSLRAVMEAQLEYGMLLHAAHDPAARPLIEGAAALAGQTATPAALAEVEIARAALDLDAGDLGAARDAVEKAQAAAERAHDRRLQGRVRSLAARLELAAGRPALAERAIREALALLQEAGDRPALGDAYLTLARLMAQDRPAEAVPLYEQAVLVRNGRAP